MDVPSANPPTARLPHARRLAGRAAPWLLAGAALVQPLAGLLARIDWRADLLVHFRVPALVVSALAAATLYRRHRRLAAAFVLLAVMQIWPWIRLWLPNPVPPDPTAPGRLRLLMANVLYNNPERRPLVDLIRRERPDVVGLVEFDRAWLPIVEELRDLYPYRLAAPDGPRGLALLFRAPPLSLDGPETPTADGWPYLRAEVPLAGRRVRLWLVHPASPIRRWGESGGFPELAALAGRVAAAGGPRVVVGDLNTTDASPHFADFARVSGLRDSRLGFGEQASWPVWSPYRIAIDHAFASPDLAVVARRLGPAIGSDHRPLVVELAPAAAAASSATQGPQSSSP